MRKTTYIINFMNSRKELKNNNNNGFSLIELVVAVGILAILSVIGVVAYSQITERAAKTSVDAAATEVYTAILVSEANGGKDEDFRKIADDYEKSMDSDEIFVNYSPATASREKRIIVSYPERNYSVSRGGQVIK